MNENVFLHVLEKYPVVRKKNHVRIEWNDMHSDGDEPKMTTAPQQSDIQSTDTLAIALRKYLQLYFSSQETNQIQARFEKAHADFVSGLSLEDMEELCAQFV